jgi:hypothetical protein
MHCGWCVQAKNYDAELKRSDAWTFYLRFQALRRGCVSCLFTRSRTLDAILRRRRKTQLVRCQRSFPTAQ